MAPNPITYFKSPIDVGNALIDAGTGNNTFGQSSSYIVGNLANPSDPDLFNSYNAWKVGSAMKRDSNLSNNSLIPSTDPLYSTIFNNGDTLPLYYSDGYTIYIHQLYPSVPCFLEGTTILCQVDGIETAVKIEDLRVGNIVKTGSSGYKKVELIGKNEIQNPDNNDRITDRLYKCSPSNYPELTTDLYITGCHSLLVDYLTPEQRKSIIEKVGEIFITENKYRLMACVDERAEPWNSGGHYTVWHLALENDEISHNYGIYVNGGLLAETCSLKHLRHKSNMILYE